MIPCSIEYVSPNDDIQDTNICTIYDCSNKNSLNEKILTL